MGFYVIKGTFHVVGYSPDGDSIKFKADEPLNWALLDGPTVELDGRGNAQLRLESIDSLETHYGDDHQPLTHAFGAMNFLLSGLGIANVVMNAAQTRVVSADDGTRGYILSRAAEKNHRPISFVFAGDTTDADGSEVFLNVDRLRRSLNYQSVAAGNSYPTFYEGFFSDLREAITAASLDARNQGLGIWAEDRTNAGFDVPSPDVLETRHVIFPKLFRRLIRFLEGGGTVAGFKSFLAASPESVLIISAAHFTHFDNLIEIQGDTVRMTELPENLIFRDA